MSTIKDTVKATGNLSIVLTGPQGEVKDTREVTNLVVQTGLDYIASRMKDTTLGAMTHMELGEDNTAPALGNSGLGSAAAGRVALTSTTVAGDQITYVATFDPGEGTGAIKEAGIFNAGVAGVMLCRTTFAVINKGAADTLTVSWTVTIS